MLLLPFVLAVVLIVDVVAAFCDYRCCSCRSVAVAAAVAVVVVVAFTVVVDAVVVAVVV